ncbi:MAG: hypothetical protein HRU29_12090 [Rhizobiales bacterium]|nr:hypothetical protein [Hyphomicrobiales bacterium]NRB15128.1 hypothetical protein [Hyphomicrobiales bacterium]
MKSNIFLIYVILYFVLTTNLQPSFKLYFYQLFAPLFASCRVGTDLVVFFTTSERYDEPKHYLMQTYQSVPKKLTIYRHKVMSRPDKGARRPVAFKAEYIEHTEKLCRLGAFFRLFSEITREVNMI